MRGDASAKGQSFDTHPLLLPPRKEHAHTAQHGTEEKEGADAGRREETRGAERTGDEDPSRRRKGRLSSGRFAPKASRPPGQPPGKKLASLFAAISELNFDPVELL